MKLEYLKKKRLPDSPGIYFFKKDKEILYIGKATSLKDRTRSYFSNDLIKSRGPAIVDMVSLSNNLSYQKTDSVLDALILESGLIKKHQPKYNVKEKDDKSFNYVVITDEIFPRVLQVRGKDLSNKILNFKTKKKFGPFTSATQMKQALKIIQKIFPFFDSAKPVDKFTASDLKRLKLNFQIGIYPDVFSNPDMVIDYKNNIKNISLFFSGKKRQILKNLEKEMLEFSKKREFEKANDIKKKIFSIEHINDVALISQDSGKEKINPAFKIESYDVAHLAGSFAVGVMVSMVAGVLRKKDYRKFKLRETFGGDDYGGLYEILTRRFSHSDWSFPDLIVVDGGVGQKKVAEKVIKTLGLGIKVVSVVKDQNHKQRDILGEGKIKNKFTDEIYRINQEAHRFAITFHRNLRNVIK